MIVASGLLASWYRTSVLFVVLSSEQPNPFQYLSFFACMLLSKSLRQIKVFSACQNNGQKFTASHVYLCICTYTSICTHPFMLAQSTSLSMSRATASIWTPPNNRRPASTRHGVSRHHQGFDQQSQLQVSLRGGVLIWKKWQPLSSKALPIWWQWASQGWLQCMRWILCGLIEFNGVWAH